MFSSKNININIKWSVLSMAENKNEDILKFCKNEDWEPADGVFAVPPSKKMIRYNIAELHDYCVLKNIEMKNLSFEEKQMFVIKD
jgi:hypothetical protein